ncbi:MAG: DUF1538 domain-containing protein [Gammaproteobacteria bacterium]|nr:DUF1538 domain-containing protein [Gammaproteobacteria bacterium]MBU2678427.1 DUF1538 domain-containing protein [Gammaproteobacteria bacterium]NNL52162.1 DUF1538 domain-containing protein [Woeseiaceae bacterium]
MKNSLIALSRDALGSLRDLTPIIIVISVFQIWVIKQPVSGVGSLIFGALLVLAGLTFFIFGLRLALFPIGENLAHSLAKKGSAFWLFAFAFVLGFGTTIAEPALLAVAAEAAAVAVDAGAIPATDEARASYALGLRLVVAFAVGVALLIGVFRILADWSLPVMIIGGYILVVIATTIAPMEIVGVAYDSGGVTTSTVTVPLVTALGVGLASSLRGRNAMTDGFGLIAFASLTPILFVLLYGTILEWI